MDYLGLISMSVFLFLGIALIYGTYARWPFLVDPPDDLRWVYSHSFLKIGTSGLVYFNHLVGTVFVSGCIYALVKSLILGIR